MASRRRPQQQQQPTTLDVYARVSRLGDDRQRSTDGQVTDASGRVWQRGAQIGEVHVDGGRSAWNPRVRRPGWDRLMERLEAGATGGVVVFDLARFSRRPIEGERLIAAAERGLLVLDSEDEYDLTSANGKKAFRDQMAGAAYESDRLSTRVRRGKRLAAMRGDAPTSSRPFGFEADGRTVRESEAAVLRDLIDRLLAGESQDAIVVGLNTRGVTTSTGGPWRRAGLRQVLVRPRNAGLIEYDGVIVARLPGEPIVSVETHERVTAFYDSRRRGRPTSERYLCSGVVLCGLCQHALTGRPRAGAAPYPDGEPRRLYWCQPRAQAGGCGRISVDQRSLDGHVRLLVAEVLGDPQHAAAVESAARAVRKARLKLEEDLADCELLAEELSGRLGRREIDLKRYDRAIEPLDRQIADLKARLLEVGSEPAAEVTPEEAARSRQEWLDRWDTAKVAERRGFLRRALRGRRMLVMPADPTAARQFDEDRVVIE